MTITKDKVVSIDFKLTDDEGELLDTSEGQEPLQYVQGHGSMIAGLEQELEGKAAGTELKVRVTPESGYGAHEPELVQVVPRDAFSEAEPLEIGMRFQLQGPNGDAAVAITELAEDSVTVDGNHPLAGMDLVFEVRIRDVRDASDDELEEVRSGCSCC